tara:strand:+ start:7900 stop:8655 length:756 start_codon:yes stop_codon:yes gene_type:complete
MNLEENLREIAEYFDIEFNSILNNYNQVKAKYPGFVKWSNLSAEEWNKKKIDQNDINEVMDFYRNTPNYIYELMEYHSTDSKQKLSQTVIELIKEHQFKTTLDFGAGICQDSIVAGREGLEATAADIPGKTFDFGKWRIKKYNNSINTINIHDETPLEKSYDAITCFEVLQHVVNPEKTLLHMINHINSDGRLFITTRFRNNYSLALNHNEYLEDEFDKFIKKCGLEIEDKRYMWGENEKTKYLYILKHKR